MTVLPHDYADARICIIGLGYVGLTLAVAMAESGFKVVGVERSAAVVGAVNAGHAHFSERGLDARLAAQVSAKTIQASTDWPSDQRSSVYIITVGTPLGDSKTTDLSAIEAVATSLSQVLKDGDMVVLRSTVRLGTCRKVVKPILDRAGVRYDLAFCPERTLEGRALEELRTLPQIVGGVDQRSVVRAAQMFAFVTPTAIRVTSLETAEMIKLVNNTQRDLMFGFANEIAEICDLLGVSASEVIRAGNMGYARAFMPMPGPVGGPCLEKDAYILAEAVQAAGGAAKLALTGREVNERLTETAVKQIGNLLPTPGISKVAILGLAFKGRPETSDLRGTLAIKLIDDLRRDHPGATIVGFDPVVAQNDVLQLGIEAPASVDEAVDGADCVIFQNNNARLADLDLHQLSGLMQAGGLIYDMWNQFDQDIIRLSNDVRYAAYGSLCHLVGPKTTSAKMQAGAN